MSDSKQQEDVAMLNTDAENNDEPTSKIEPNEGSGDSSNPVEHSDVELAKKPWNTTDLIDNLQPLSKTSTEESIPENDIVTVETGYKETVVDDTIDADIKLHWTDDEEDQKECPALSEEALKQLDEELGIGEITDSEIHEKTNAKVDEEISYKTNLEIITQDTVLETSKMNKEQVGEENSKKTDQEIITQDTVLETSKMNKEKVNEVISNKTDQEIITQDIVLETSKMKKDDSKLVSEHVEALPKSVAIITKSHEEKDQEAMQDDEDLEKTDEKSSQVIDRSVTKQSDKSANHIELNDQTSGEESTGIDKNMREMKELINQEDKLIDKNKMINDANKDSEAMDIDSSETENKDLITTDGVSKLPSLESSCKTSADEVSDIIDIKTNSTEKDIVPAEVEELETVKKESDVIIEAEPKALIKSDNKNIDTGKNYIIEPIESNNINSKPDPLEVTQNEIVVEESVIDANVEETNNSSDKINDANTATENDNIGINSENNTGSNNSVNESTKVSQISKTSSDKNTVSDISNSSIQINTEHKINRPNVMLDIPTQEFDFDDDLEDSLNNQAEMEKHSSDSMTSRTVTDLVNQLSKDIEIDSQNEKMQEDIMSTDESKTDTVIEKNVCNSNTQSETTPEQNMESGIESTNTVKIEQSTVENADKIKESDPKNINDSQTIKNKKISAKDDTVNVKPTTTNETELSKADDGKIEKDDGKIEADDGKIEIEIVKLPTSQSDAKLQTKTDESSTPDVKIEKQNDDIKPSTSQVKTEIDVAKPSTSDVKPTSDSEVEVPDSLSLLAESSRVMDDDEDDEQEPEDEPDVEGVEDDDDDFDPDEEGSSNQMTSGSEESNPAHSEVDIQEERIDIVYGNEGDSMMATDSTDANDEFDALKAKTEGPAVSNVPESETTKPNLKLISKLLKEDDTETKTDSKSQKKTETGHQKVLNIVDLESSEDDDGETKQAKEQSDAPKPDKEVPEESKDIVDDEKTEDKTLTEDITKVGEVFNLDSDEEEKADNKKDVEATERPADNKCINYNCTSDSSVPYYMADRVTIAYYGGAVRRKRAVCQHCLDIVTSRNEGLMAGIKDDRPLMALRMSRATHQPLEISDSDSEDEEEALGEAVANILGDKLTDLFNETWIKYNMDDRIKDTEAFLDAELEKMQKQGEEIDKLLRDCQVATDKLRVDFYSSFEPSRKDLPAISIHDTPIASYACLESEDQINEAPQSELRYPKRRSTSNVDIPAKKQALASDGDRKITRAGTVITDAGKFDDDKDISVVRLSVEAAPVELPPHGDIVRPPLKVGVEVYAMKNQYGAWLKGKVLEILPKSPDQQFSQARIRFSHNVRNPCKVISARSLAYTEPAEVRMTIGTRVIALFQNADPNNKRDSFYYSGVIAEIPNPVNNFRYLIFFDDGYVQYVHHKHTRLVYESSALVWEEVHPYSREFVSNYLMKYPERPMVRMHRGQSLTVEWNDKWWDTIVTEVDAALVKVHFPNNRIEWIYRGSTRLQPLFSEFQAARRGDRARLPRSTKANTNVNMPYVEYTRSEESGKNEVQQSQSQIDELRRQRAVAKKSTALPQPPTAATDVVSRVVFYTPKNSVRPYKMVPHRCGLQCNRTDLLSLKDLRTYNPLTKPLLSGWERLTVRHKYCRDVMYRAPCGRRLRNMKELHRYLRAIDSELSVDLFDFNVNTHCLAEFVLNKTNVQKKDLSHGKENVPVPCVNYYDHSLPEFCSYNTERTPTAGVPLNLDPDFMCGCDCEDDCMDKTKCACWKMTLEGARTIGMEGDSIGYEYRRLPEPLPSGIYECNSRCKCKSTCLNRVVQHPLQLKLQVFKTLNRGWGIRALNDVPKGAFLCIYAGNLLTDATANLDGLNEGDEYLAELDYIEVVESMKEGYEDDIPEADKKLDKKESKKSESEEETEEEESEEEDRREKNDEEDGDFQPVSKYQFIPGVTQFNKKLRRRDKKKNKEEAVKEEKTEDKEQKNDGDECITISDDEEVRVSQREPSRFTAQANMNDSKVAPKYRSIRTYFGKDEACYIMDAKVQGNIGRYLNHSCSPNVFVQNVFVDTHDPRFPWVSFFALHHIRAGTELTWNYNYDIGSVPGKVLYCFCGAPNCRGRLL